MKTKEEARNNLEASLGTVGDRYKVGVSRADWQTAAGSDNAERNFAQKMSEAVSKKSRQIGVKKVSNADWQNAAGIKGGAVIGQRMRESLEKQAANWGRVYDGVVSDIGRLPARTTDFRQNITNRVVGTVESWKKHSGRL